MKVSSWARYSGGTEAVLKITSSDQEVTRRQAVTQVMQCVSGLVLVGALGMPAQGRGRGGHGRRADFPVPAAFKTVCAVVQERMPAAKGGGTAKAPVAARFQPGAQRIFLPKLVRALSDDPDQRRELTAGFEEFLKAFDRVAREKGMANNLTLALTAFTEAAYTGYSGKSVSEASSEQLLAQMAQALDSPKIAALRDAEKQEIYEYAVCMASLMSAFTDSEDAELKAQVKILGTSSLEALYGVSAEKVALGTGGVRLAGKPETGAGAGTSGTGGLLAVPEAGDGTGTSSKPARPITGSGAGSGASGKVTSAGGLRYAGVDIRFTAPADAQVEKQTSGWVMRRTNPTSVLGKNDRVTYVVLPALSAKDLPDRDQAFEEVWKTYSGLIQEKWQVRSLIYRFPMQSGAMAYMARGGWKEKVQKTLGGTDGDELTLCLLDFGDYYAAVGQMYSWRDSDPVSDGENKILDQFLESIRVAGVTKATPKPWARREQLVGEWSQGSGVYTSTSYYNATSGAYIGSDVQTVATGLRLKMNADGTGRYRFSYYVNGRTGVDAWDMNWRLQGNWLVIQDAKGRGKTEIYAITQVGKDPKTGTPYIALYGSVASPTDAGPTDVLRSEMYLKV